MFIKPDFKVFFHRVRKDRSYRFVFAATIAGLSAVLIILGYLNAQLYSESWITDRKNIFRIDTKFYIPSQVDQHSAQSPGILKKTLEYNFPELNLTRVLSRSGHAVFNEAFTKLELTFVDEDFPSVFPLYFVAGNWKERFDPSDIYINVSRAMVLFGKTDIVGQSIEIRQSENGVKEVYRIAGVFRDLPVNSQFRFSSVLPLERNRFPEEEFIFDSWTSFGLQTFMKVSSEFNVEQFIISLPDLVNTFASGWFGDTPTSEFLSFHLVQLDEIKTHMVDSGFDRGEAPKPILLFQVLMFVVVILLAILVINLGTFSYGNTVERNRELAIRRALGASKSNLSFQMVIENLMIVLGAVVGSLLIVEFMAPSFSARFGIDIRELFVGYKSIGAIASAFLLLTLLASIFPVYLIQRLNLTDSLKSSSHIAGSRQLTRVQYVLVFLQVLAAVFLLIFTSIVFFQVKMSVTKSAGFSSENLFVIENPSNTLGSSFRNELMKLPDVLEVASAQNTPGYRDIAASSAFRLTAGKASTVTLTRESVSVDFFKILGVNFLTIDETWAANDDYQNSEAVHIILNASATKLLGFKTPNDAIRAPIDIETGTQQGRAIAKIVGVVEDFNFYGAREEVHPAYYLLGDRNHSNIYIKTALDVISPDALNTVWRSFIPDIPLNIESVDDLLKRNYQFDYEVLLTLGGFTVVSFFTALFGFLTMAQAKIQTSEKKVTIHKVFGADRFKLYQILLLPILLPVIIASIVSLVLSRPMVQYWLEQYTLKIDYDLPLSVLIVVIFCVFCCLLVFLKVSPIINTSPSNYLRE
ncbi:FtsX-like permease family protein [Kordiimonas sp. SCSIO 12603]|uniref:ABC transporter permease n=1 Tax=Kordiimonas sp. SCSIO 12603 TaxID=2829596 RepID=UPI0021039281|nr:ABC transporter permease [Kordiimonas sp. SCSIO 12603]UTW58836.1 FtsX-like permease family protein [Kordiimonas sp. SCSIO 12603]